VSDLPTPDGESSGVPAGETYDWFVRARSLHDAGDAAAAVQLLERAVRAEPAARSLREALGRAQFDARMFVEASVTFRSIVDEDPADHYAQFGLGASLVRAHDLDAAITHLAIAVALRPESKDYDLALKAARAGRRARLLGHDAFARADEASGASPGEMNSRDAGPDEASSS
jgi:tetratricopeptide (TPR) repeat protein